MFERKNLDETFQMFVYGAKEGLGILHSSNHLKDYR